MKGYVYTECAMESPLASSKTRGRTGFLIAGSIAAVVLIAGVAVANKLFSLRSERAYQFQIEPDTQQLVSPPSPSFALAIPIAPFPHIPVAIAPPPRALPEIPPPEVDSNGFIIHSLAKRIDERSSELLSMELLKAREVSFSGPPGLTMPVESKDAAKTQKPNSRVYVDTILSIAGRSDLAGLPFRFGREAMLTGNSAQKMDQFAKQFRQVIQTSTLSATDKRLNIKVLHATLIGENKTGAVKFDPKKWITAESIQCLQQMLQSEDGELRRMTCELFRAIDLPEATEALVKWAVFDIEAANRAAAVDALRTRDQKEVTRLLLGYVQYPWVRAVEHAAEALVELNCREAVPQLVAAYEQPDPAAPFRMELPNQSEGTFRREVVRVNHARNCVTCHAQSFLTNDCLRAAIPDPERPLPPSLSLAYYNGRNEFVRADVTYLRQDFSVVQPVAYPGKWSAHQRYDYFVSVRRENDVPSNAIIARDSYRQAIRFAIVELSKHDPDTDSAWLSEQRKVAVKLEDGRLGEVARFISLETNPGILSTIKAQEIVQPLLSMNDDELSTSIQKLQKTYGMKPARLALIAYLDPLTRSGESIMRSKAARLLVVALSHASDEYLSSTMRDAAGSQVEAAKQ